MVKIEQLEQSLLSRGEYRKQAKFYKTYNIPQRCGVNHGNPPPCWKMGERLSPREIEIINGRLGKALKEVHRCENGTYPGIPFTP